MEIFELYPAANTFKGIISIPHSGETIPDEFTKYLVPELSHLMQDVDYRVHHLVDIPKLQKTGITVIKSNIIRTAVDLNRSRDLSLLNWKKNSKGVEIVKSVPDEKTSEYLLGNYYDPYYEILKTTINELHNHTEIVSFVDLHSMPGVAEDYHLKINPDQPKERPDFCISDISGISCQKNFIDKITRDLRKNYPNSTNNMPYFGGHITRHLNASFKKLNNIQIEINRSLYMNESNKVMKDNTKLKENLTDALIQLFETFY